MLALSTSARLASAAERSGPSLKIGESLGSSPNISSLPGASSSRATRRCSAAGTAKESSLVTPSGSATSFRNAWGIGLPLARHADRLAQGVPHGRLVLTVGTEQRPQLGNRRVVRDSTPLGAGLDQPVDGFLDLLLNVVHERFPSGGLSNRGQISAAPPTRCRPDRRRTRTPRCRGHPRPRP